MALHRDLAGDDLHPNKPHAETHRIDGTDSIEHEFNVKAYGAVGDGVVDDTVAINNAIIAANGGGTVFLPKGTYRITSSILMLSHVRLVGGGTDITYIFMDTAAGAFVGISAIGTEDNLMSNIALEGFSIYGVWATKLGTAIRLEWAIYYSFIRDVKIYGVAIGIYATSCYGLGLDKVNVWQCSDTGYYLGAHSNGVTLLNCTAEANTNYNVYVTGSAVVTFLGCIIEGGTSGVTQTGVCIYGSKDTVFYGCYFEGITTRMVDISGGASGTVFNGCWFYSLADAVVFFYVNSGTQIKISSCNIYWNSASDPTLLFQVAAPCEIYYVDNFESNKPVGTVNSGYIDSIITRKGVLGADGRAREYSISGAVRVGTLKNSVNEQGIYFGATGAAPEGAITAPAGSLYLRYFGGRTTVYIKDNGVGNTGWLVIQAIYNGTTAQRPTGVIAGFQYLDTTLNKPIWYTGSIWIDAIGAEV